MQSLVYLAQTDTTLGLLSTNEAILNHTKNAPSKKKLLTQFVNFKKLRIPSAFKSHVRHAKRQSFIIKGKSFRVSKDTNFNLFLKFFESGLYSSSANMHKGEFSLEFAKSVADVYVLDKRGFKKHKASKIYKLNASRMRRLR
ncbi:hypothetical protein [Helicobacter sp. 11S02629-2]|uniref:hypothetical protein n=1 Tax=Helicobacter sp. 11S02629-2 TaxID=1476195 RepID=UPI000BA5CFC8|nr:hypothetical protein [Helicobacter sp. 11S02629-2]